jgi:hypothetical protein
VRRKVVLDDMDLLIRLALHHPLGRGTRQSLGWYDVLRFCRSPGPFLVSIAA